MEIPLVKLCIGEEEVSAVSDVLRSGWLLMGPRVREFEKALESYFGVKHVVCVSSCTAALHLAVLSLNLKRRDKIAVPDFTFPASANAVIHGGAEPFFCDISPFTFTLSPSSLILTPKKVKAIIQVHLFGVACFIDEIKEQAARRSIPIIYDAAGAFGAEYKGRKIGCEEGIACFSFDTRKILTCSEGGAILTDDDEKAGWFRMMRSHGSTLETWDVHRKPTLQDLSFPLNGLNYRMTEIQAAIGLVQLGKVKQILRKRREHAKLYNDLLDPVEGVVPPHLPSNVNSTYQSYVVSTTSMSNLKFIEEMRKRGVQASYASRALHLEPCFKRYVNPDDRFSVSEALSRHASCLPIYPALNEQEVHYVVDRVREVVKLV